MRATRSPTHAARAAASSAATSCDTTHLSPCVARRYGGCLLVEKFEASGWREQLRKDADARCRGEEDAKEKKENRTQERATTGSTKKKVKKSAE